MTKTNGSFFALSLNEFDCWLAPLAGVCDAAFRAVCCECGARLMTTEMVSAKGIYYKNENTNALLALAENETHTGLQLFGSDPEIMAYVVEKYLNDTRFAFIDINMGCPVKKVVSNGEGSALMNDVVLAAKIVSAVKKVSNKPVSVKTRLGFDNDHINVVGFCKALEEAGADLIAIHGRTREMMFSGFARFEEIARVKQNALIPIVANGDVKDFASYQKVKRETGCDGVMIGRAAMGNPFIFTKLRAEINNSEKPVLTDVQRLEIAQKHLRYLIELKGERIAVNEFRAHFAYYTRGIKGSAALRDASNRITAAAEMNALIDKAFSAQNS